VVAWPQHEMGTGSIEIDDLLAGFAMSGACYMRDDLSFC